VISVYDLYACSKQGTASRIESTESEAQIEGELDKVDVQSALASQPSFLVSIGNEQRNVVANSAIEPRVDVERS